MLSWGVTPVKTDEVDSTDKLFENAAAKALESGLVHSGELALVVAGTPLKTSGTTNMLKAITLGDTESPMAETVKKTVILQGGHHDRLK